MSPSSIRVLQNRTELYVKSRIYEGDHTETDMIRGRKSMSETKHEMVELTDMELDAVGGATYRYEKLVIANNFNGTNNNQNNQNTGVTGYQVNSGFNYWG